MRPILSFFLLLAALACQQDRPTPIKDLQLKVEATFPGACKKDLWSEQTPFGEMAWHGYRYAPPGRMDESFHVEVGNLPPGKQGGNTTVDVLKTYETWLTTRFPGLVRTELPAERGPGFRYRAPAPNGYALAGVVVLRQARMHHAQATVRKADDPRLLSFLDSFQVF